MRLRIGTRRVTVVVTRRDHEVRDGDHDQARRDAQRVVLDPAGLDLAESATPRPA